MKKIKVVVVNGVSRSGKNKIINFLCNNIPVSFTHSTINTVKDALCRHSMLDKNKKGVAERTFLAAVKQAWINYSDGPLNKVIQITKDLESIYKSIENVQTIFLFVQVREPSEIKKLYNYFKDNFTSILVKRKTAIPQQKTDTVVEDWDYDYIIYNNGTLEEWKEEACKLADKLMDHFMVGGD